MWFLFLAFAWAEDCATQVHIDALRQLLARAKDAYLHDDLPAFEAYAREAQAALPCLGEALDPYTTDEYLSMYEHFAEIPPVESDSKRRRLPPPFAGRIRVDGRSNLAPLAQPYIFQRIRSGSEDALQTAYVTAGGTPPAYLTRHQVAGYTAAISIPIALVGFGVAMYTENRLHTEKWESEKDLNNLQFLNNATVLTGVGMATLGGTAGLVWVGSFR